MAQGANLFTLVGNFLKYRPRYPGNRIQAHLEYDMEIAKDIKDVLSLDDDQHGVQSGARPLRRAHGNTYAIQLYR